MTLLRTLYELFPPKTREKIKLALSTHGHGASRFDALKARDHALGKKRLDRVAEALVPVLGKAGITSLKGRACLEFGAGYAPTEALLFHLLGASASVATDYNAIARLDVLYLAAREADRRRVLELVSPLAAGVDVEQRLDAIVKADPAQARARLHAVIDYVAPHDMSQSPLAGQFDVIHSLSVFEHLPPPLIEPILGNLLASLDAGGTLVTEIDLRDHLDFDNAPLAFLGDAAYDPAADADRRGNSLRHTDWLEIFARQPALATREIYLTRLAPAALPPTLTAKFRNRDSQDMLVSWLGLASLRAA